MTQDEINYKSDLAWSLLMTDCALKGFKWGEIEDNKKFRHAYIMGVMLGRELPKEDDLHFHDERLNDLQKQSLTKIKTLGIARIRPGQWQSVFGIHQATIKVLVKNGYGTFELIPGKGPKDVTFCLHPSK